MARYINNSFNPAIRYLMNRRKVTVLDISKLLNRSAKHTYIYLNNPNLLTIQQVYILASYFEVSVLELFYLLTNKQKKLTNKDTETLQDLINRNKESI